MMFADCEVWEYHEGSSNFGTASMPDAVLINLVSAAFGGGSGGTGEAGAIYEGVSEAITMFGNGGNQGTDRPAAYVNYILFDKHYAVLDAGWQVAPDVTFTKQKLWFDTKEIEEEGFLFVYLSYDNDSSHPVYFDDFKVTHTRTNVIQYNEYYPFGLQTADSWTRENHRNDFLYNQGSELNQHSGWYETFFRGYDPILGRFLQVDPLSHEYTSFTPYHYALNNPITWNDPNGDRSNSHIRNRAQTAQRTALQYLDPVAAMEFNVAAYGSAFGESFFPRMGIDVDGPDGSSLENILRSGKEGHYVNTGEGRFTRYSLSEVYYTRIDYYTNGWESDEYYIDSEYRFSVDAQQGGPGDPPCTTCPNDPARSNDFPWLNFAAAELNIWGGATAIAVNGPKPVNLAKAHWTSQVKAGTKFANRLGGAGLLVTGVDMISNGVNTSNSMDAYFGGISFAGPWGAAASAVYFTTNLITVGITEQTIGEHVDNNFYILQTGLPGAPFIFIPKKD